MSQDRRAPLISASRRPSAAPWENLPRTVLDSDGPRSYTCAACSSSALVERLREHDQDAAGAADIGELLDVLVRRHPAERMAAVSRGDLERSIDVID